MSKEIGTPLSHPMIRDVPVSERPRERMVRDGADSLRTPNYWPFCFVRVHRRNRLFLLPVEF